MQDEEKIEPLPEEIAIGKVIDEENTKTFKFSGVVLYLDDRSPCESYEGCVVEFENPVEVTNSSGETIGCVTLNIEGKAVMGEFFLDYHCPERLNLETKSVPMYSSISALESADYFENEDKEVVKYSKIFQVKLTDERPFCDPDPL